MSRRANPTAIGLFLIGAILLILVGLATFASADWFDEDTIFVSRFRESVNGLDIGAPVKFKGVPVGQVTDLLIRIDLDDRSFQVPVIYKIDMSRLNSRTGTHVDLSDPDVLQLQINDGLRAKLQMESIVTGKLYVELTYVTPTGPVDLGPDSYGLPEIPTTPSLLASISEEAGGLVEGLQTFDISVINENLIRLLVRANEKIDALDVAGINTSLVEASQAFEDLARSPEIRVALREVPGMSEQFNLTMLEAQTLIRNLDSTIVPVGTQLEAANTEIAATLQMLRQAVGEMQRSFSTDSGIAFRMEEALISMTEAAEALELLARSLERNPSMLIRGKIQPE